MHLVSQRQNDLTLVSSLLLLLLQVATLMAKVSSLEAQNSQLRIAGAKREQVLQQSRKFIEGHLAKWAPGSPGSGAAAAAAAGAATATTTAANGLNNGSGGLRQ
jgi:prephenate dehydratase